MDSVLRRGLAFVLACAGSILCAVSAAPPPVDASTKSAVADLSIIRRLNVERSPPVPSADARAAQSLDVLVEPTSSIGPKSPTTSAVGPNESNSALSKGIQTLPSDSTSPAVKAKAAASMAQLGQRLATFVENKGQWDARAKFRLVTSGKTIWLTDAGIVLDVQRPTDSKAALGQSDAGAADPRQDQDEKAPAPPGAGRLTPPHTTPDPTRQSVEYSRLAFSEEFIGANKTPALEPIDLQLGTYNYLIGSDRSRWHTDVHGYGGLIYRDVWKGVDFKLVTNGTNLEQEFVVRPGGDPTAVKVAYRGTEGLMINPDGSLVVRTKFGELADSS
jgi:hypothetical protein